MVGDYLSYFNIPEVKNGVVQPCDTIQNKLLEYIEGATLNSEIRGHITRISKREITDALIKAHTRGVKVYLVQNGECLYDEAGDKFSHASPEGNELHKKLGPQHHRYGYAERKVLDKETGVEGKTEVSSCVSNIPGATHHIKNWMFSNTMVDGKTRTYSTWVTSYNLTKTQDTMFNDVFIVNDNQELYNAYVASFASFFGQQRTSDFYNVEGRGHHVIPSANTEISYSPHTTSPGQADWVAQPLVALHPLPEITVRPHTEYHLTNDHVAMALSKIDGFEPGCSLKVANLSISSSRWAIIEQLLRIKALGCPVQVAYSKAYGTVVSQLLDGQVEVRQSRETIIHSKMMLYKGRYDGTPGRTFVWGGSHNWTQASLRQSDEVFVAISRLGIYERYSGYFDVIWERSTPP
jgi:hypothetical protein